MIKLVEVIDELEMGGAQHVLHEIITHLDKEKFDITIICFKKARPFASMLEQEVLAKGFKVIYLKPKKRRYKYLQLMWELTKIRPDVIHAHQTGIVATYWGFLARIKTIITIHTKPARSFIFRNSRRAYKFGLKTKSIITVAISAFNKKLCQEYWNIPEKEVCYVNNGVNIDGCVPESHDCFSFINVGRQDENKNQILIIKAFNRFLKEVSSDVQLYLVGDGECKEQLQKAVAELNIEDKVIFTGYIANPRPFLAKADVYISSSHREGLPLSVLEGMAFGLPVIATDVGGVRDLAQENGYLIEDDDEDAMFNAMRELYKNPEICKDKGAKSLEIVQQYTTQKMADGYAKLFEEYAKK